MKEIEIIETPEKFKGWNIKRTKHSSHRSYWKWHPAKKKDNWEPLKKPWRKTWNTWISYLKEPEIQLEVWHIVNYLTFWKSKIENEDNRKAWLKPNQPMSLIQACREYWINHNTFYQHLKKFPAAKERYYELRENRREYLKESAEANIEKALTWWLEISDKDMLDASFKMLEKTDKNYNPKIEIETKSISINLNKSSDDIINDLNAILWM